MWRNEEQATVELPYKKVSPPTRKIVCIENLSYRKVISLTTRLSSRRELGIVVSATEV